MPNFKSISFKMAVLQAGADRICPPPQCVCHPKDPMWNRVKSEQLVEKLINVMTEEFSNPFYESLSSGELFNLSSGISMAKEMVVRILGEHVKHDTTKTRLGKKKNTIHNPVERQKLVLFKNTGKKVLVHQ